MQDESRDNRSLVDNNTAQTRSSEDMEAMKREGASGDAIVEALIAPHLEIRPCSHRFMRVDALSLLLSMANVGAYSDVFAVDMDAIEECRKLCGGHGYLINSGLPELFAVYVPACTYEGDNVVLLLQVGRFFMKTVSQVAIGNRPVGTVAYIGNIQHLMQCKSNVNTPEDWLNPATVKEVFEARALRMAVKCAQNINKAPIQEEGFSELSPDFLEDGVAQVQLIIVTSIYTLHLLHKHLAGERATAHFDVDAMKVAWAGSRHAVEVADRMARFLASDPCCMEVWHYSN
ncbi:hypothetical protein ZWY2020_020037 [Hordeum vulgare]|nr:hypothetical protein ZWY2020_020037 [Hordeum vulgare]